MISFLKNLKIEIALFSTSVKFIIRKSKIDYLFVRGAILSERNLRCFFTEALNCALSFISILMLDSRISVFRLSFLFMVYTQKSSCAMAGWRVTRHSIKIKLFIYMFHWKNYFAVSTNKEWWLPQGSHHRVESFFIIVYVMVKIIRVSKKTIFAREYKTCAWCCFGKKASAGFFISKPSLAWYSSAYLVCNAGWSWHFYHPKFLSALYMHGAMIGGDDNLLFSGQCLMISNKGECSNQLYVYFYRMFHFLPTHESLPFQYVVT